MPSLAASNPDLPGKRERNKAGNRAAILAAARRVFAELGYEAATVRDVIGATPLASGTFYNYFPDKEAVLRALLEEKAAEMRRRSTAARRGATTVEDIVRLTIDESFAMVAEDPELFSLMQRNAGAIRAVFEEPAFVAGREDLRDELGRALAASGAAHVDAGYLVAAISGLAFEVAAAAADRGSDRVRDAARFATDLVLGGLRSAVRPSTSTGSTGGADGPSTPTTTATPTASRRTIP